MTAWDIADRLIRSGQVKEFDGKNRGPMINKIVKRFGGAEGSPYCAYGVSYTFYTATRDLEDHGRLPKELLLFPYSGSSQAIMGAFKEMGRLFTDPDRLLACKGALFGWTDPDRIHGHIGEVGHRLTSEGGSVVAIGTGEFNTSLVTKSRDGEGAYFLRRSIDELRRKHPNFWFCDTTNIVAGSWWA